ncbi:hypothetical protein Tco_0466297 [Tanacetum coccineum]
MKEHIATLKGKSMSDCILLVNNSNVIAPGMYKLDLQPLSPKLWKHREAHVDHLKMTKEHADTLCDIVEQTRAMKPLDNALDYAFTPVNKKKKVRFTEPSTSISNTQKQVDSHNTQTTNKPLLTSTGVNSSVNASGSKPKGNTRNDRISLPRK